uniref:Uncharacterized protein n=1 Tax=Lepeophtheirus salmonis TaxID=72036 RepID=A0A0K2VAI3_LEPSM
MGGFTGSSLISSSSDSSSNAALGLNSIAALIYSIIYFFVTAMYESTFMMS